MSSITQTQPAEPSHWRRRLFLFSLLIAALLLGYWFGIWGSFARRHATHLMKQAQLLQADQWYQTASSWGDDSQTLAFQRSRLARKLGRDQEFLKWLKVAEDKGLAKEKSQVELYLAQAQRGDLSLLQKIFAELLISGEAEADEVCQPYVEGLIIKYQLDDALQILDLWQADYPKDARPHFLRGRLLEHRINLDGAKQEFQTALDKNPRYAAAAYNLGRVLETEQKPDEAIPYYDQCSKYLGNAVPGLVAKARCLRLTQNYEAAQSALTEAEAAASDLNAVAYRLVGDPVINAQAGLWVEAGYLAAALEDHVAAVDQLMKAVNVNPNDWRTRYQLALSQRQIGEAEAAKINFQKVDETKNAMETCDRLFDTLRVEPDNIAARLQIGQVFLEHLSENQGLVWLESVLDIDPQNIDAHRTLAEYFQEHQSENAQFPQLARQHAAFLPSDPPTEEHPETESK